METRSFKKNVKERNSSVEITKIRTRAISKSSYPTCSGSKH